MDKDIRYQGYSTVPSDYASQDGELAYSLNLINEDGTLRPVFPPKTVLTVAADSKVVYIHKTAIYCHYIVRSANDTFTWINKAAPATSTALPFISGDAPGNVCAIGNTLVFSTPKGLLYLLWKDGAYIRLGYRPPFTTIAFGSLKMGTLTDEVDHEFPDCPSYTLNHFTAPTGDRRVHISASEADKAFKNILTDAAYGLLLSSVADNVTSKGYFYQPFFVRYAYRLFDGSYAWHSAPVLMLPTATVPFIKIASASSSGATLKITSVLDVDYFSLVYRIYQTDFENLEKWQDIISGIDVFVSAPIYTYDQSEKITGKTTIRNLLLYGQYDGYTPELRPGASGSASGTRPPSRGDGADDDFFIGHYADSDSAAFKDHTLIPSAQTDAAWGVPINKDFHDKIRSAQAGTFYRIASLKIDEIEASSAMKPLSLELTDLSSLVARPTLADDYRSHFGIVPQCLYAYNSRLNAANIELLQASPLPYRATVDYDSSNSSASRVILKVWSRHDGVRCYATDNFDGSAAATNNPSYGNIQSAFPRYIYYPDSSAYKMSIQCGSFKRVIKLTPHDFLNGAYWYGGLAADCTPLDDTTEDTDVVAKSVPQYSKLYTSDVNNPFIFPVRNINTVGTGAILGLSSAAKALSQGQFGQFPLYAFTTEGVWAMELNTDGSFIARQPITRDVCLSPASITQLDSAVLFATDRGIMLISGSQTQCISDVVNAPASFDISSLPQMAQLHNLFGHNDNTCLPVIPFLSFIVDCRMIYDYVHQRVIIFSPSHTYAYVYSLKSRLWGMTHSALTHSVNSYPEALAMDDAGHLVDISQSDATKIAALCISRPVKLDVPDIHKTISSVIQRGVFRKGEVKTVLYGSRDLYSWHLIFSSTDHFLRGFSGTPYKYFRFALVCDLSIEEWIDGCSVRYTPRLTDQPR